MQAYLAMFCFALWLTGSKIALWGLKKAWKTC